MIEIHNTAAGRGHVRAVFSERCRGFAAPLDLVRVHLRAVGRLALRARLSAEFAGYLVTDCADDAALRRLEIYGRKYIAKKPAFSRHRAGYQCGVESLCVSGGKSPLDAAWRDLTGGPLDAPDCLPAGACDSLGALFGGSPQIVALREPLPVVEPFTARRGYWLDYTARSLMAVSGPGGGPSLDGLRDGFENGGIDAPLFMAAGSWRLLDPGLHGVTPWQAPRLATRKGYWS